MLNTQCRPVRGTGTAGLELPGTGQAAALNQDGSVNSASNPAAHGSIVTLFVTGVGAMQPQPADGSVPRAPSATPALPIRIQSVAYSPAWQIQYAGDAPGLVEGAVQLNVLIPESLSAGAQSMLVEVGGTGTSPYTSVTIFTK